MLYRTQHVSTRYVIIEIHYSRIYQNKRRMTTITTETKTTTCMILPSSRLLIGDHSSRCTRGHIDGDDSRSTVCSRCKSCSGRDVPTCNTRTGCILCKRSTASRCTSHSKTLGSLRQTLRSRFNCHGTNVIGYKQIKTISIT